ncbi:MAG: hypothetical protein WA901_16040 [Phormidesmis sp.]
MAIYTPAALLPTATGLQIRLSIHPSVLPATLVATATDPIVPTNSPNLTQKEELRHILLGSPSAIRQVIYQLHTLHYVEPTLWSPITAVSEQLIITPKQGEAISLLRRSL